MRLRVRLTEVPLLLLLSLGLIACGGGEPAREPAAAAAPDATTPEGTVQMFFDHLNEGRSEEALALYTDEARQALEDPEVFGAWASQITREGTIETVRIEDAAAQAGGTTVDFYIVYRDGSEVRRSVQLEGAEGQWRMGLIL